MSWFYLLVLSTFDGVVCIIDGISCITAILLSIYSVYESLPFYLFIYWLLFACSRLINTMFHFIRNKNSKQSHYSISFIDYTFWNSRYHLMNRECQKWYLWRIASLAVDLILIIFILCCLYYLPFEIHTHIGLFSLDMIIAIGIVPSFIRIFYRIPIICYMNYYYPKRWIILFFPFVSMHPLSERLTNEVHEQEMKEIKIKKNAYTVIEISTTILKVPLLEDEECCVCLESYVLTGKIMTRIKTCQHKFCSTCVLKWFEQKFNCPLCRVDLNL